MSESNQTTGLEATTNPNALDHREVLEITGNQESKDQFGRIEAAQDFEATEDTEDAEEDVPEDALKDVEEALEETFEEVVGFERVERHLRQDERRIYDRLKSIEEDAVFVSDLAQHLFSGYPLVANERCGPWYFHPEKVADSCFQHLFITGQNANTWSFFYFSFLCLAGVPRNRVFHVEGRAYE